MKKLLAGLLIGGLFSLGCADTTTKPTPKKDAAPPVNKKMNGDDKMKDEGAKPEIKPETKPDSKKPDKKDSK